MAKSAGAAQGYSSSSLDVEATSIGGKGGAGLGGANGGVGGSVSVTDAVSGSTSGEVLVMIQSAQGGEGGWTTEGSPSGAAGNGGSASSTLTLVDHTASSLDSVQVRAVGGAGGSTDNEIVGAGGDATARLTLTSTAATSTNGSAVAIGADSGGRGGGLPGQVIPVDYPGAGGNASATVAITVSGGSAQAGAYAEGGLGATPGSASAQASVSGASSGYAGAASIAHSETGSVTASANSPVGGPASATTFAEIGSAPLSTPSAVDGETISYAEFTPGSSDFGKGAFSVGYGGTGELLTYEAGADFAFSTTTAEALSIDLGSGTASGAGFDNLEFEIIVDGQKIFDQNFTESEAEAFFDGSTLALGIFAAGNQTVALSYLLTAAGDPPSFSVIYGLEGIPTGSPVPEPSTWAMLLAGFAGLGVVALRRGRWLRAPIAG